MAHVLHIQASAGYVCGDQHAHRTGTEVLQRSLALILQAQI
jgi:hypothetical protein